MKHYIGLGLLAIITGIWLFFTSASYSGLNSIQQLANYHEGLVSKEGLPHSRNVVISNSISDAKVYMDTLGIPHIYGKDANAIGYAIGFMHARDRYFQMELMAYTVMGRQAEMLGEPGISSDKYWKRFDLEAKAVSYLDTLSRRQPDLYNYLKAYEAGVNAYIKQEAADSRDPLYTIWNWSPHPWRAYYTFFIQWYMSSDLTFYDDYMDRQEILDKLPDSIRQVLYPTHPDGQPVIVPEQQLAKSGFKERALVKLFQADMPNNYVSRPFNKNLGSNNWVIGGSHTKSGQLFLCNDFHLSLVVPNIFYEAHLSCPGMHAYGYTIPGVPLLLSGHNENIAWGATNGGWDVTEQYLLKVDPKNTSRYWLDGKWETMTSRDFVIDVKGKGQERISVQYTAFGPLVKKDTVALGLKWYPQQSCSAIESFWKVMHAGNWNSFREALRSYDYPSQNFAYADTGGNIGMICAGKMPVKPAGYAGGLLDGTHSPQYRYIPFDSLPQSYNPPVNYLFSANQEPEHGKNYYAARWFDDLYRPKRINEMLGSTQKFDREDVRKMQLDQKDLSADDLRELLKKYATGKKLSDNWESLRHWDGILTPDSREAVFYKYFRWSINKVSSDLAKALQVKQAPNYDQFMHFLLYRDSVKLPSGEVYSRDYFNSIISTTDSLYAAISHTKEGANPYAFTIPQMTLLPGLSIEVEDIGGSENTINVNYQAHPVIRTLVEIKDKKIQSWMVNATGQTGRLNEKSYLQQFASWKQNTLHPAQFVVSPSDLQSITDSILFTIQHK